MPKLILSVVFLVLLNACGKDAETESQQIPTPQLLSINPQYWDKPSKDFLREYLAVPQDKLSYSQKKHLSEILIVHEKPVHAINLLETMNPSKSQYLTYLLATAFYSQGQLEQTLEIIENKSGDGIAASTLNMKYKLLLEMGQSKKLIQLARSNEKQKQNSIVSYYLAMALLQNRQCDQSIQLFERIIAENPYATKIYGPLASAYQQCENEEKASQARKKQGNKALSNTDEFLERLQKNGDPISYYNEALTTAVKYNNTPNIVSFSETLIKLGTGDATLFNNYAISLRQSRNLKSANKALFEAIKLEDSNIKSYQLLYEFNRVNNIEIAEKAINRLIEIDPNNALYKQAKSYLYKK